ncbi:hypothetical protein C8F04DRAFT_1262975 [Mycena alexandri]|uniref:MYND-type domain-containing protein n=1 Tax=Mycena alexandri TaxID=1745969 RepID=A0AAD6X1I6_9AGAR|nr:hypothetical protein C8F04DRAFT_1262975 [Mycena alexandri]
MGAFTACTNCLKTRAVEELRRCSKCKRVLYCSTECRAQHWPTHKSWCTKNDDSKLFEHTNKALHNPLFHLILQACFILQFDLLRSPRLDRPFEALIELGIQPVEFSNFSKIFTNQRLGDGEIEAMIQLNSFDPPDVLDVAPARQKMWHQFVNLVTDEERAWSSVGIVQILCGECRLSAYTPVMIGRQALELVRASRPWSFVCPTTGKVIERPFSIESCMEFLNNYIRRDKDNTMLLRTKMRASDVKLIRDVKAGSTSDAVEFLRAKMRREEIFKPLKEHVREENPKLRIASLGNVAVIY